jgi:maltooligosyltrehalose trehalohydrolase
MNLNVWAPAAKSVELVTNRMRRALQPLAQGYWQIEVPDAALAEGYKYSLDGGLPVPDPRSAWQPDGVHGASHPPPALRHVGSFNAKALEQAVIYEMHVGTFTPEGTYAAARGRLEHLVTLGVTHIELMPLASFPGKRGWGYDGVDLFAPFAPYGTPQQLAGFIDDCHAHGIAVILDVVYNHLGPDGNYLGIYAPYFTDRYKTGWGEALNYDGAGCDGVRRFVIDNALMWLRDYGFDGLRLDAVHAIFSFEAVHLLEEMAQAVRSLSEQSGRRLILIAESDLNDPRLVRSEARGGYGLDAQWVDDFHHAVHRLFTGETDGYYADFDGLEDVALALRDGYVYQGQHSRHRGRRHGRAPTGVLPQQFIVSAQNHDQIGNRAQGERLSMLLEPWQLKAVAALLLLSPFVPMLFQGEEWGAKTPFLYFTDHGDELGRLVAEGRAKEFSSFSWQGEVPNPQSLETFERSRLEWDELSRPRHAELFDWHRRLIALRGVKKPGKAKPAVKFNQDRQWLRFAHQGVLAVFNLGPHAQRVPLPPGEWELQLHSDGLHTDGLHHGAVGEMPAQATFIYAERSAA